MRLLVVFFILWSSFVSSATLQELDARQSELAREYIQLTSDLPSPNEIADLAVEHDYVNVRTYMKAIRDFFQKYDEFNLDKIDYFQNYAVERARNEAREFVKSHKRLSKKLQKHLRNLEESRVQYLERKIFFGTERDTERLDVGQTVLHHYGKFAKELRKIRGEKVLRNFGSAKIVPFIDKPKDFVKTFDLFMVLLWNSYFHTQSHRQDEAPIPDSLQKIQSRLVKMREIEVKWDGLENIGDVSYDGKTVNMFLINHANSFMDTSAQQAFPLKGMSAMGNVDVFFPGFLAKRMAKSNHMIAVGHGDIIGKTKELIENKQLNKFFLAIEGITGTGLYEMRPVLPLFHGAVYEAIERGLEVQLHPVAFPDHFRLLNDWRDPVEGKLPARGVVLKPFHTSHCLSLLDATSEMDSVGTLIRWAWFSTLRMKNNEVLSMPYPKEIAKRLEWMIWGE